MGAGDRPHGAPAGWTFTTPAGSWVTGSSRIAGLERGGMRELGWLRARALEKMFGDRPGHDVRRLVWTFLGSTPQVYAHERGEAFALRTDWGSVVTWGRADSGGDSSRVAAELSGGVRSITAKSQAFAAVKEDGSVVTWGDARSGGDSRRVAAELSGGVRSITAGMWAFAAVKEDGSVVTWGRANAGGDSSGAAAALSRVRS